MAYCRYILLVTSTLCLAGSIFAQEAGFWVKGKVFDKSQPVAFANLAVAGSAIGTSANQAGEFQLRVTRGVYAFYISAVGYESLEQRITVSGDTDLGIIRLKKKNNSLDPVIVSASLRPQLRSESPVSVQVLTPATFKSNPTPSLLGAVAQVNGVRPQINCSVCSTSDIHINGMEGPYTMILIDGMPIVSGLSSVYGLSGIPTSLIERIEVVKGPGSSLYGSEAMGGIINVITKDAVLAPRLSAETMVSQHGELQLDAGFTSQNKHVANMLGVNTYWYDTPRDDNNDGFTDLTLQKRVSVFNKLSFRRKQNKAASIAARFVHENRWGGELDWNTSELGGERIYGESIKTNRFELIGQYRLPGTEDITFQASMNGHFQDSYYGTTYLKADQRISFGQLFWQKELNKRHELLLGTSVRHKLYNDNTVVTESNGLDDAVEEFVPGFFIQDELRMSVPSTLLMGYRLDLHQDHGAVHSPRLAYKYQPNGRWQFRASFATGFRVVDVFTEDHAALTGSRTVVIADDLAPERSVNGTANIIRRFTQENSFVELDLTVFHSYFSNRIVADLDTDQGFIFYNNLEGYGVSQGISFDQNIRLGNKWTIRNGISRMRVFTKENGLMSDQLFAPDWSGTMNLAYAFKNQSNIDVAIQWYGPMRLPVQAIDVRPEYSETYAQVNIQYQKKLKNGFELFGGVKNVLNFIPNDALLRPFDPFDQQVNDPVSNPNGNTFDTTYIYASLQGRRAYAGIRYLLDR